MPNELKQAIPSALALRGELEAMVLKELLGPGSGDEEITDSPGTRYFVGVLAPRRVATGATAAAPAQPVEEEEDEPRGEILDGDELALGGRDTTQDGTTDLAPAQDKALIPSS